MTSSLRKLPDSRVELTIDLDQNDLKRYFGEAEKQIANQVQLKGFRPGKVPPALAKKHLGEEEIHQKVIWWTVENSLAEVIAKEKLEIILNSPQPQTNADKQVEIKTDTPTRLVFQIILPVFPEIKLGRYRGLGVKNYPISVSETEIQNTLRDLTRLHTVAKPSDQPARLGDRVEVDFNLKENGQELADGKSLNHPLILGQGNFVPGFEEQIVGMKVGENKRFALQIPPDYFQKSIAGKKLDAEVTLKKTEALTAPELDDDFAKKLGKFSGLGELKANVSQGLLLEKEAKEKQRVRAAILGRIIQTARPEVPPVLIEDRLDSLIRDFDEELHRNGLELGLYLAKIKKTQDDLRRDWRPKAEVQVKQSLVTRAVAKKENIKVSDDEVAQELAILVDHWTRQGMTQTLEGIDPEVLKIKAREAILNEKALAFLEENNAVT